jgi:hypothetical protein
VPGLRRRLPRLAQGAGRGRLGLGEARRPRREGRCAVADELLHRDVQRGCLRTTRSGRTRR